MRKKAGVFCIILGVILIFAAAGLAAYNIAQSQNAASSSSEIVETIKNADSGSTAVGSDEYIGIIKIPSLGIELPVMSTWDYTKLKTSPCRYYGAAETNDLVIAAHNYTSQFGKLTRLNIGDEVIFIDISGTVYTYAVGDIEQLLPTDTEKMIQSDWDLTLYTCTLSGTKRVTVRCELRT